MRRRERVTEIVLNSASHGIGVVFSIFALIFLLVHSEDSRETFGIVVFGVSLILLYLSSTLYHAFPKSMSKVSMLFKRFDHSAIYLLIAGTYTPYIWLLVPTTRGYMLLMVLWLIAIIGIVLSSTMIRRFKAYHLIMYVVMGWSIVFIWTDVAAVIPDITMTLLFAGGIAYTGGLVFYAMTKVPFAHMIWHFFVLSGSVLHFLSIYHIL